MHVLSAGAAHIRRLHAVSPASGSNISLSTPGVVKMKMNPPADLEVHTQYIMYALSALSLACTVLYNKNTCT